MRLINCRTLQLEGPFSPAETPPYAILSHTWGEDELSYKDMISLEDYDIQARHGFEKISQFCARALRDDLLYGWVDTVCIDKTSSAELSEAINSMFKWYKQSVICYVLLEDFRLSFSHLDDMAKCRWFTRGWTLQELLAPSDVEFVDSTWTSMGSKKEYGFMDRISDITGIDHLTLSGLSAKRLSVAQRMSWASHRATTRPEDLAYCLLGIFGINMPLLYGEGSRAFIRLQEEIARTSNDQSIFAWSTDPLVGRTKSGFWSLFAPSPAYFKDSAHFLPVLAPELNQEYLITNQGVRLTAFTTESQTRLVLSCRRKGSQLLCTIPIVGLRSGPNHYAKTSEPIAEDEISPRDYETNAIRTQIFVPTNIHEEDYDEEHYINYVEIIHLPDERYTINDWFPFGRYSYETHVIQASSFPNTTCGAILRFRSVHETRALFFVCLFEVKPTNSTARDVVAVCDSSPDDTSRTQAKKLEGWLNNGGEGHLESSAEILIHEGIKAWKLKDGTFVRVEITRGPNLSLDSVAVAEIYAGASWERDILPVSIQDMTRSALQRKVT